MPAEFHSDELIFSEGEIANRFYLIVAGEVVLETETSDHRWVTVDTIVAGDVLGWSWLFPPYTAQFTARALGAVRARFFYGTWLRERCEQDPTLGYGIMQRVAGVVIRRLQAARKQFVRLASSPVAT